MELEEFDDDKSIEPGQLDVEAVRQPDVFFKWAERAAAARGEVERLKLQLEVMEARLQFQIRENPEKHDITAKITEAVVAAAVIVAPRRVELAETLLRARAISAILDRAVEALDQKKRMLEILVTLHGQQYFAGPSVPHDLVADWREHQKGIETSVNDRQRQRARARGSKEDLG